MSVKAPFTTGVGSAAARDLIGYFGGLEELSKATVLPGKVFSPKASERELKDWVRSLPI